VERDPDTLCRVAVLALAIACGFVATGLHDGARPGPHAGLRAVGLGLAPGVSVALLQAGAALALATGGVAWRAAASARTALAAATVAAAALAAVRHPPPLAFADVFALATLYHLLQWLGIASARRRRMPRARARRARRRLLALHAATAGACVALALGCGRGSPLHALVFSPGLYLCWSTLHVAQTAWARGLAPPASSARRPLQMR